MPRRTKDWYVTGMDDGAKITWQRVREDTENVKTTISLSHHPHPNPLRLKVSILVPSRAFP